MEGPALGTEAFPHEPSSLLHHPRRAEGLIYGSCLGTQVVSFLGLCAFDFGKLHPDHVTGELLSSVTYSV